MIKEPGIEFTDHKHSKLSVGIANDPWGLNDGDAVPTYIRICVCERSGQEIEFYVSKDAAPKFISSVEETLKILMRR